MTAFLAATCLIASAQLTIPVDKPKQTKPLLISECGLVLNIGVPQDRLYPAHWKMAEGWTDFVRINIAMEQEGWFADPDQWKFERLQNLGRECAKRKLGVHLILGGLPPVGSQRWQKLAPAPGYQAKRYREMPREWWFAWVAWQKQGIRAFKKAYGFGAESKVRLQMPNEVFDRGEDDVIDRFFAFAIPLLYDGNGTVYGLPLDGPSLWGPRNQLTAQIMGLKRRMAQYPDVYASVREFPLNIYPPDDPMGHRDPERLTRLYVAYGLEMWRLAQRELGRPAYFSEIGFSRVQDLRASYHGSRVNELANRCLLDTLRAFRAAGVPRITIYQSADTHAEEEAKNAYGLADSRGMPRISLMELKLATGRIGP